MNNDEIRSFVQSLKLYEGGLDYCGDDLHASVMTRAAEVINSLLEKLEQQKQETKENIPPAPPIEKKKKAAAAAARACTREFVPPVLTTCQEYGNKKKIPPLFVAYWYNCMETNYNPPWFDCVTQTFIMSWRRSLVAYWNNAERDNAWYRWQKQHANDMALIKPRVYTAEDWLLCHERCARFDAQRCKCRIGVTCPPQLAAHPHSPEECPRYKALSNE